MRSQRRHELMEFLRALKKRGYKEIPQLKIVEFFSKKWMCGERHVRQIIKELENMGLIKTEKRGKHRFILIQETQEAFK